MLPILKPLLYINYYYTVPKGRVTVCMDTAILLCIRYRTYNNNNNNNNNSPTWYIFGGELYTRINHHSFGMQMWGGGIIFKTNQSRNLDILGWSSSWRSTFWQRFSMAKNSEGYWKSCFVTICWTTVYSFTAILLPKKQLKQCCGYDRIKIRQTRTTRNNFK